MKHIENGSLHVMVIARGDGAVGLMYTSTPTAWLEMLAAHMAIEQSEIRPSAKAARIVAELRGRFAQTHLPGEAFAWYLVDFKQAVRALDEYDPLTGLRREPFALYSDVMVVFPQHVRGRVCGFSASGRQVAVQLDVVPKLIILAARENVKPILRAAAVR